MKTNTRTVAQRFPRLALMLVLCVVFVFSLTLGLHFVYSADAVLSDTGIKESYTVGTELDIPKGILVVDGSEYEVKPLIIYPDGTSRKTDKAVLDQKGEYTLYYSIEKGGKIYSDTKEFGVYDYLFSVNETGEPLKCVDNEHYGQGVAFSIANGQTVNYNKVININEFTKNDPFIIFEATPKTPLEPEVSNLFVRLTDCYDESNYVTIRLHRAPEVDHAPDGSYSTASSGNNDLRGWVGNDWIAQGDGAVNYGAYLKNGLRGNWEESDNLPHIKFSLDHKSKEVYINGNKIINLANDFGDNGWNGFTTGEVRLSFWGDGYYSTNALDTFNGLILAVDGKEGTELYEAAGMDGTVGPAVVEKTSAPAVDFGEYETASNVPHAMVGFGYKIFQGKAYETYGGESLSVRVYYGYNTSAQYEIPVIDGCFTPDMEGLYTIVYTSRDVFGNSASTKVDVYAEAADKDTFELSVDGYDNMLNASVGIPYEFVGVDGVTASGNLGSITLKITATHQESGTEIDLTNASFIPVLSGKWTITYSAVDYVGRTGEFSYDVECVADDGVVFDELRDLPKYFITGVKNPVPSLTYKDYNDGGAAGVAPTIYATINGAERVDITDGWFTPTKEGEYTLTYVATSAKNVKSVKTYQVTAIDVHYVLSDKSEQMFLNKYFRSYDGGNGLESAVVGEKNVTLTLKDGGKAEFIRPVDAVNFDITFNFGETVNAKAIEIAITDVNNENQKLVLRLEDVDGGIMLVFNGKNYALDKKYKFNGGSEITIEIKGGILNLGATSAIITQFADGSEYTGFESMLANLDITAVSGNTAGNTQIAISKLCGQTFSLSVAKNGDSMRPRIISETSTMGLLSIGDTLIIKRAKVYDVLSPYATAELTVTGPDGNITAVDGTLLKDADISREYTIIISKAGSYNVNYMYRDGNGNATPRPMGTAYKAVNREKPVINVNGGERTGKVGSTVKVDLGNVKVTASTEQYTVTVYVRVPGHMFVAVKMNSDGKTGTFETPVAGIYTVRFMALDTYGNMSVAEYEVKVN